MAKRKEPPATEMGPSSQIIADDKNIIPYRARLARYFGSIPAAILFEQILYWRQRSKGAFYKFAAPCEHDLYTEDDSWEEELGFTRTEFESARKKIAVKATSKTKNTVLKANAIVFWIDQNRVTWYDINTLLVEQLINNSYCKNPAIGIAGNQQQQSQDSDNTHESEITPKPTRARKSKAQAPSPQPTDQPDDADADKASDGAAAGSDPDWVLDGWRTHPAYQVWEGYRLNSEGEDAHHMKKVSRQHFCETVGIEPRDCEALREVIHEMLLRPKGRLQNLSWILDWLESWRKLQYDPQLAPWKAYAGMFNSEGHVRRIELSSEAPLPVIEPLEPEKRLTDEEREKVFKQLTQGRKARSVSRD